MTQKTTLVFALALAAALPLSAEAQGRGKGHGHGKGTPPGQLCRAEGGTSNSRACRDRYGDNNRRRDDRDSDWYDRDGRRRTSRSSSGSVCVDRNRDGYCDTGTNSGSGVCVDRNRDGRCDNRTSGSTACVDRNRDGYCDNGTSTSSRGCVDRNRDGRCDNTSTNGGWDLGDVLGRNRRYPSQLPLMQYAPRYANGERLSAVRQWLGSDDVRVRYTDRNRDGRAETATWLNPAGNVLQVWQDLNYDGRADRVQVYDRGQLVRTIQ